MTLAQDLIRERGAIQDQRRDYAEQQKITRDLDMVRQTLKAHVDRLARNAEATRTPAQLAGHVARLLRRHDSGDRRMVLLMKLAENHELGDQVRSVWRAGLPPGLERPAESHLDLDKLSDRGLDIGDLSGEAGAFAASFTGYLRGQTTAQKVVDTFEREVDGSKKAQLTLRFVRGLHAVQAAEVRKMRGVLNDKIANHVATLVRVDGDLDVDAPAALKWHAPVAMLPIRLETRFRRDGNGEPDALMVRVYPSQIHVDTHENALTQEEEAWGRLFWAYLWYAMLPDRVVSSDAKLQQALNRLPSPRLRTAVKALHDRAATDFAGGHPQARYPQIKERAWAQGVEEFGAERAAYVVHSLSPLAGADAIGDDLLAGWASGRPLAEEIKPLTFPDVDLRPDTWTQTPTAVLLPDRWIAYAFYPAAEGDGGPTNWQPATGGGYERGLGDERVLRMAGTAIREPLPVSPGPDPEEKNEIEWMVNFGEAEKAGMGLTLPLPDNAAWRQHRRFSRLIVLGLKTSMDAGAGGDALRDRLLAAQYTEGLELLNPGTPTNNADTPSARSTRRPPAASVETAVGPRLAQDRTDGAWLASALGVPASVFDHVAGAGGTRQQDARAMNAALWPATLAYYVRNLWQRKGAPAMLSATWPDDAGELDGPPPAMRKLESYHQHFVDFVRGGGPLPTVRVGQQPYGILPASPLDIRGHDLSPGRHGLVWSSWEDGFAPRVDNDTFQTELAHYLWRLRRVWLRSAETLPSVAKDPGLSNEQLLTLFSQESVAYGYRRQTWLLGDGHPLFSLLARSPETEETRSRVLEVLKDEAGILHEPRIADLIFLGAWESGANLPVVDDGVRGLTSAILLALSHGRLSWLQDLNALDLSPVRSSLLRQLVTLAAWEALIGTRIRRGASRDDYLSFPPEPTRYGADAKTIFDHFSAPYVDVIRRTATHVNNDGPSSQAPDPTLAVHLSALRRIGEQDDAKLARLTGETLDLVSHRLDAWWTSLATRRLYALRDEPGTRTEREPAQEMGGVHIGGFGFVEDVKPGGDRDAEYLLAPSLDQATTAALLRGVHKARAAAGDPQAEALAIKLTAPRVRKARRLFEAVRRGLSLGEILGYRFERGLHEKGLARYIHKFRPLAPLIEGKMDKGDISPDGQQSDVVDGLQLYRQWKEGSLALTFVAAEDERTVEDLFESIDDTMDAAHDLLLAEGVHHLVHGRPERAAAALEAMSRAGYPPIPQVVDTPRTETGVNHRLMVMFGDIQDYRPPEGWRPDYEILLEPEDLPTEHLIDVGDFGNLGDQLDITGQLDETSPVFDGRGLEPLDLDLSPGGSGPSGRGQPFGNDVLILQPKPVRFVGEPNLDAWIGELLPAPSRVGCRGEFRWTAHRAQAVGTLETPKKTTRVTVKGVGFRPDVIRLTASAAAHNGSRWIHGVFRRGAHGASDRQAGYSVKVDTGGDATAQPVDRSNALTVSLDDGTTITGRVEEVHADGFTLAFSSVSHPMTVAYHALKTTNPRDVKLRVEGQAGAGSEELMTGGLLQVDTPTAPTTGRMTGPTDTTALDITTGFRPGLLDLFVLDGSGGTFRVHYGAVRDRATQHWLGDGPAPRVGEIRDDGFTLDVSKLDGSDLRLVYRAWPEEPTDVPFDAAIDITLDKLELTPLDAIFITQATGEAGDSQLERRMAYYALRHLPKMLQDHPPVPLDAALDLHFDELPDQADAEAEADVTVAEYIEAARAIRNLIGDARPADARDLNHPDEEGDEGYFADSESTPGTATQLQRRAAQVEGTLEALRTMLRNRIALLDGENNVTTRVDDIVDAAHRLRQAVPLSHLVDRTKALNNQQPSLRRELEIVARRLRTGPTAPDGSVDLHPAPGPQRTLEPPITLDPGTDAKLTVRSYSDAVTFRKQTQQVKAGQDGSISAEFDFDGVPPGTAFTLSVEVAVLDIDILPELIAGAALNIDTRSQLRLLRMLNDRNLLDADPEETADEYRHMELDERRRFWTDRPRGAQIAILDALTPDRVTTLWRPRVHVFNGRVADAPTDGAWHDLARTVEEDLFIIPTLLWLERFYHELETGAGADGAAAALKKALNAVHHGTVKAEIELMSKVLGMAQAEAPDQRAFTQADVDAAEALEPLLGLNLSVLHDRLKAALEPLRWTGLDRLLAATGRIKRPDQQRVTRAADPKTQTLVPKHAEGEVRARLERLLGHPELHDDPPQYRAYSRVFRHVIEASGVGRGFVKALEQLLSNPAAATEALTGFVDEPLALLHRLHAYMHHGEKHQDLATQLDLLLDRISRGDLLEEIAGLVDDTDALTEGVASHRSDLLSAIAQGAPTTTPAGLDGPYANTISRLKEPVTEQVPPILALPYDPDPARAFRTGVLEGLRRLLLRASYFGIYGSTPASPVGGTRDAERRLLSQAENVVRDLTARHDAARRADPSTPPTVTGQVRRLKALLGRSFTVLPPFIPTNLAEVHATFAAADQLLQDDPYAPETWLQQISHVREHPAMFRKVRTYANAFALSAKPMRRMQPHLVVGQLPHTGGKWVGSDEVEPEGGELAFGVDFATWHGSEPLPPPTQQPTPVAGLLIDGWVVGLPQKQETLGLGLQYDDPNSRAPQAMLLAVPPGWRRIDGDEGPAWQPFDGGWTRAALLQTIEETMDLMDVRLVDLEALQSLGHLLPALCFPYNANTAPHRRKRDAPTVHFDDLDWS